MINIDFLGQSIIGESAASRAVAVGGDDSSETTSRPAAVSRQRGVDFVIESRKDRQEQFGRSASRSIAAFQRRRFEDSEQLQLESVAAPEEAQASVAVGRRGGGVEGETEATRRNVSD